MANGQGGLAAVTEEEVMSSPEPSLDVSELVERTTSPEPGQSISSLIMQHKQENMDMLREGRARMAERRASQQKANNRNKWLSLAQGMLAPTQTGSFGESLGTSAGLLRQQSELRAKHEAGFADEAQDYDAAEIAARGEEINQRISMEKAGRSGFSQTTVGGPEAAVHPDDIGKDPANQRMVLAQAYQDPTAEGGMGESIKTVYLTDENGEYIESVERADPRRMGAITRSVDRAAAEENRSQVEIGDALIAYGNLPDIDRAMAILKQVDPKKITTSGINALKNRVANILGVSFGDTEDLTELQMIIADNYLKRLADLKGSSSDTELREMKNISAGIGQNPTANYRALVRMRTLMDKVVVKGIREAVQRGNQDTVFDLWPNWDPEISVLSKGAKGEREYADLKAGESYYEEYGGSVFTKRGEE